MSLHNLATVFGPSIIRPCSGSVGHSPSDLLTTSTVDVMAQAGILYFFLRRRAQGLPLTPDALTPRRPSHKPPSPPMRSPESLFARFAPLTTTPAPLPMGCQ
ncbi:hypothetical protein HPB48_017900 [Haemaphysalis longicornis]|uniref:Rho-GAP domain-containing protein n=1 Tax=Haemaphysalis longicornis TaxID=44386 RepID=A0A9J6GPI0_HAELO|nr:hypothetical protein HPB48_017900 [Haemaphysalis longicornis]